MSFVDMSTHFCRDIPEVKLLDHTVFICMLSFSKYRQFFKVVIPFILLNNV